MSKEALDTELGVRHSKKTFASFGMARFTMTFVFAPIDMFLMFFYTQIIGLHAIYFALAMLVFSIWDAFNNPLIAWMVDRNFKWTAKWGRRFPWIVLGGLLWGIGLFLLFSVPALPDASVDPIPVFLWLLFALFLFDFFTALSEVNLEMLRPDKFRTEEERRLLQGYNTPLSMIAQAVGMLIPPLFLANWETTSEFVFMGAMCMLITFISVILYLPGAREDQVTKDIYLADDTKRINYFKGAWEIVKMRSFWMMLLGGVLYMTVNGLAIGTFVFILNYGFDSPGSVTIVLAVWLIMALVSVPFWMRVSKKFQNTKKMYALGMVAYGLATLLIFFYVDFVTLMIFAGIMGFTVGAMWIFGPNIAANVYDDYMVKIGKNQKGIVTGVYSIFNRLAATIDTYIITAVWLISGFAAYSGIANQAGLIAAGADLDAILFGFRLQIGLIPTILLFVGAAIFWKFYPLNPERVLELKVKLQEMGI